MTVYRTTLPPRIRPVDTHDFAAFADDISFGHVPVKDGIASDALDFWNKNIPYYPSDIFHLVSRNFPQKLVINFSYYKNEDMLEISYRQRADRGFTASFSVQCHPVKEHVDCHITVEDDFQGQGYGKGWLRTAIELSLALGHPDFKFDAGSDNGAYTWGRLGVSLDMDYDHRHFIAALSDQSIRRLDAAKEFIPTQIFERVRSLCDLKDKDDLVRLTSVFFDVSLPHNILSYPAVGRRLAGHFNNAPSILAHGVCKNVGEERRAIHAAFESACAQNKALSLPRYLLAKGYWPAIVDFSDNVQMKNIGDNIGGWHTIASHSAPIKMPALVAGIP